MILVDFNQVVISNFIMQTNGHSSIPLDEGMLRHMILNTIRSIRQKFFDQFGELVICCDSRKYWRKEYFPFYKANRKKDRETSDIDWITLFNSINVVRQELQENFPYKIMIVEGAEADDIIATLVKRFSSQEENILIVSSDKDFMQLQSYKNVTQYSPILKKNIKTLDPKKFLKEHIVKGDRGDGIPNILSNDNVFVSSGRQKPIRKQLFEEIMNIDIDNQPNHAKITQEVIRNWNRNKLLVDLSCIPEMVETSINSYYDTAKPSSRSKLLSYFISYRLKNLTEHIGEF